jgi:hypothetical protein
VYLVGDLLAAEEPLTDEIGRLQTLPGGSER